MKRAAAVLLASSVVLLFPAVAGSSYIVDRNVVKPTLKVNRVGVALVTYTTLSGTVRHVLAWGAVNGVAHPTARAVAQPAFNIDPTGGFNSSRSDRYWKTFRDACRPYHGPKLPFFVAGCDAPDGSFWALQIWQRNLPSGGFEPLTPLEGAFELHLSHWTGPLPKLHVWAAWMSGGTLQGLFGQFLYRGRPVYGAPGALRFTRNVKIDSFDSDLGPAWRRVATIALNTGNGTFCHAFVAQPPPPGYPSTSRAGNGLGSELRVDASGPGVTPIVEWTGPSLSGTFTPEANARARRAFASIFGDGKHCATERPS